MRYAVLLSAMLTVSAVVAAGYESVYLSDGSVLDGYIKVQGNTSIVFNAERAEICLPDSVIETKYDCTYNREELDSLWRQSGELEQSETVVLNDITLKRVVKTPTWSIASVMEHHPKGVKIVEDGDVVKFIDLTETTYTLPRNVVERIVRRKSEDKLLLSGIIDKITLTDGGEEIEGRIVEIVPGRYIKMDTDKGVRNIRYENISVQTKEGRNPEQTLAEQSEYIDKVVYKEHRNGEEQSITGVIFKQDYIKGVLTIETKDKRRKELSFGVVVRYEKSKNPDYKPVRDIVLSPTEIRINSKPMEFREFRKRSDGSVKIEGTSNNVEVTSLELVIEMCNNDVNKGYVLFPFEIGTQKQKHKEPRVFDSTDMVMLEINHDSETLNERNNVLRRVYKLISDIPYKYYVLYNVKENKGMLITIVYRSK